MFKLHRYIQMQLWNYIVTCATIKPCLALLILLGPLCLSVCGISAGHVIWAKDPRNWVDEYSNEYKAWGIPIGGGWGCLGKPIFDQQSYCWRCPLWSLCSTLALANNNAPLTIQHSRPKSRPTTGFIWPTTYYTCFVLPRLYESSSKGES